MRAVLTFAGVLLVLSVSSSAHAQSCASPEQILDGLAIPADGASGVPINATPFLGNIGALELRLVGPDGNDVASDVQQILVGNNVGAAATMKRIVPSVPLLANQTFTVIADGAAITHFTVGDASDTAAPGAPTAASSSSSSSCTGSGGGGQTSLTVGVEAGDAVLFVGVVNGQPTLGAGARLDSVTSGNQLVLFGTGSADVDVAGVDLAGNVGVSTPVHVEFPALNQLGPSFACACTGSARGAPVASLVPLVGIVVARARRRWR